MNITRILIANRGEIACRIVATAHALGIETVAIFTAEDALAQHTLRATSACQLRHNGAAGYLDEDNIIAIAQRAQADAIHPGYGFLSEQATFAQKVVNAGLAWIGPKPDIVASMAHKMNACRIMQQAGVPTLPSFHATHCTADDALLAAQEIGFPVLLKAALGGGGKGMRRVDSPDELKQAWERVQSESTRLFASADVIIEKYLANARHIEVQVAGDGTNAIHLFERECSIQRRHQKIIEETPCHFIPPHVREQLHAAAVSATRALRYDSIGTLEFLVSDEGKFYFLEMNTRLQVEHPVTELTTGIDLVALQIAIAQTKQLPCTQSDIVQRGHALQCRLYAEDPDKNFLPSTGTITHLTLPEGPFVRHDHALKLGQQVTANFDPMLSKLVTYGDTRELARARMLAALSQLQIEGLQTNRSLLIRILQSPDFITGNLSTQWLAHASLPKHPASAHHLALAKIAAQLAQPLLHQPHAPQQTSHWRRQQWQ